MSLILDALRKLDREKSSRRTGTAHIAVDILRPDLPRPGKRIPLYVTAVFFTAVATAVITYAVMVEVGFLSKSSPPATVRPFAPSQKVTPAAPEFRLQSKSSPPAPMNHPAPSQKVAPSPPSREPVRDAREKLSKIPEKIQAPAESKIPVESKTSAPSLAEEKTSHHVITEETSVAPVNIKKPTEHPPSGPATTPPSLRLSGIVWYEEPSRRLAVINGTIATEGSLIEGVKVVEISPTRVRLSYNGQLFEISIGQ
jgi:hypothetical protein